MCFLCLYSVWLASFFSSPILLHVGGSSRDGHLLQCAGLTASTADEQSSETPWSAVGIIDDLEGHMPEGCGHDSDLPNSLPLYRQPPRRYLCALRPVVSTAEMPAELN